VRASQVRQVTGYIAAVETQRGAKRAAAVSGGPARRRWRGAHWPPDVKLTVTCWVLPRHAVGMHDGHRIAPERAASVDAELGGVLRERELRAPSASAGWTGPPASTGG